MSQTNLAETLYATGYWLLGADRQRQALGIFRLMVLASPTDERAWLGIAVAHQELDEPDAAIDVLEKAVERLTENDLCARELAHIQAPSPMLATRGRSR